MVDHLSLFRLFLATVGRDWLDAQFGEDAVRSAGDVLLAIGLVIVLVLNSPTIVTGMCETLAEPATGPDRLSSIRRRSR